MDLSYSMKFVVLRAQAEGSNTGTKELGIEYFFLGLLKFAEIKAKDAFNLPEKDLKAIDADIAAVRALFEKEGVDTDRARPQMRHELKHGAKSDPARMQQYLEAAADAASHRGENEVWGQDLLYAILKKPTDTILQVCPLKGAVSAEEKKQQEEKAAAEAEALAEEMTPDFLSGLTDRIRRMRAKLLGTVQGQDHVVHAFAEGIFAAEVLSASDEKRKRPRAIFVFAGPPGVGKTFLAEQAAEALELPFKRFDMSTYADHQSYMGLVGFEKSYQGAKEGLLTGFVKQNPHCILLFDEIEKAHLNTVQLFLQILDAGRLSDRFLSEDIAFKDTIIIFTTNAGKSLYEGDAKQNAAGIPRQTLISALETENDPRTGQPFFPSAIASRLSTGWPLLFNHLEAHDLEKISRRELERFGQLFEKQYGVKVQFDPLISTALMFQEGAADARTVRAQTELFFKNEIFKICRLWDQEHFLPALKQLHEIRFTAETENLGSQIRPLFYCDEKPEILLYGDRSFAQRCRAGLPGYVIYDSQNVEEALELAGEKDIRLVLLDVTEKSVTPQQWMATVMEGMSSGLADSAGGFNFAPMAARALRDGSRLLRTLRERLPEMPVYLLEMPSFTLDEELVMSFIRAGARGKISAPDQDMTVFEDTLQDICRQLYMQGVAARLASERKVLFYETAPALSRDQQRVTVRLRDFALKRAAAAEDTGAVLDDVEKPNIRFDDVIGASDAKQELKFFTEYLKNPKKFCAQGLKPPKGILLYGPPGTGKTMLAKALAGESDVAFLPAVASSFVTKWQGSGPEAVRSLFKRARRYAPAIIFIDEIDAIGRKRGEGNSAHGEEMALNALLTEMDGFSVDPRRPVFVMAATNFDVEEGQGGLGVIDPALARRFDRRVLVDLPNADDREKLLRMLLKKRPGHTVSDDMIRRTAERAMGMSPAALTGVVESAERMAVKAGKPLDDGILDEAYELSRHGAKKDWGYEYLERVARHESGHAFLCYLGGNTPSYLTIVARGDHGGYMEHSAKDMGPLSTREELINRIRTALGGRAAEIAYYGEEEGISTGASGDLEQATRTAAAMLCAYGMDEDFGLAAMDLKEALRNDTVRRQINEILKREMRSTVEIIRSNRYRIDRMVDALMKKNKLTGTEMEELLKE
ncbi:MAG: AAA family ATPase [Clostridia bacterium]|nr:AAA family ATPase [Clostridia bacterium]